MKPNHNQLIALIGTDEFLKQVSPIVAQTQNKPWKHNRICISGKGGRIFRCNKCGDDLSYNLFGNNAHLFSNCTIPDSPEGSLADWSYRLWNKAIALGVHPDWDEYGYSRIDVAMEQLKCRMQGCGDGDAWKGMDWQNTYKYVMRNPRPEFIIIAALMALELIE